MAIGPGSITRKTKEIMKMRVRKGLDEEDP